MRPRIARTSLLKPALLGSSGALALCGLLACGDAGSAASDGDTRATTQGETGDPECGDGEVAGSEVCDDGADNGVGGKCKADCSGLGVATVEGDAIPFDASPNGRIAGAEVSILEFPDRTVTTGADGKFKFEGLPVGADITLTMTHPDYHPIQTGTHVLPEEGLQRITFQAVTHAIYDALAAIVMVTPDDSKYCQMVTTVTRVGKSIYDEGAHGEAGVVVTLDPPLPAENGPIYFNSSVIPEPGLTETSDDGGVLFVQVPPGEYTWTATKAGAEFRQVRMKCRVGWLVNAAPPWGLQRL
ncbi:carboxypeptidase regulatory-like domain-containing protein [Nannocystis exedens]|nr:carboxypeptidase regulatory-like domain-containing protein [Nannocystis exedens]